MEYENVQQKMFSFKNKRTRGLEVLYFMWQCVQKYIFEKSQDKPHKFVIF